MDNPELTVRHNILLPGETNPTIILLDSDLKTPLDAKIWNDKRRDVIIVASKEGKNINEAELSKKAQIWRIDKIHDQFNWDELLGKMYQENLESVLVEGGQTVFTRMIESNKVDKCHFFVAPKLIMDKNAYSVFCGCSVNHLENVTKLRYVQLEQRGDNIEISGYLTEQQ